MIDSESKCKLSHKSTFETRSLNVLELVKGIFCPVLINPVNTEPSIVKENWPSFNIISDVNFTIISLLVPYILSGVNVKPMGVLKMSCDHPNSTWEHVNTIHSRPLTNIVKRHLYAVTRNFAKSIQAHMDFYHCLSPY